MKLEQFHFDTIAVIRKRSKELDALSDQQIARLYHEFSEGEHCAGWLIEGYEDSFIEWATTPPYKRESR